jgi:hypothetical protein
MDDLISRKTLLEAMDNVKELMEEAMCIPSWATAKECIRTVKPVDAVEVVRCKDCGHYTELCDGATVCDHWGDGWYTSTEPDAFCSYGVKMDGGKE